MSDAYFTGYEFESRGTDRWAVKVTVRCENLNDEYICILRDSPGFDEPREFWSSSSYSGTITYSVTFSVYPNMLPMHFKVRTSYIPAWADTMDIVFPGTRPSEPTAPIVIERIDGGFRAEYTYYWGTEYTEFRYRREDGTVGTFVRERDSPWYATVTRQSFINFRYGTRYEISVRACNQNGCSSYSPENPITINPKTPTSNVTNITSTSISITVSGMEGNFDNINISGWRGTSSSGTSIGTKTITKAQYDASNRTVTFSGLTPDQDYYFEAQSNITVSGTTLWSLSVDTVHAYTSARPNDWTWTAAELSIFNNGGKVEDISYLRWNAFIDRVNDFAVYCGVSQLPGTVKMSSSDRTLYASDFKAVAQKIHDMSGAVASELRNVSSGDDVNGWYFPHLATALSYIE